MHACLNVDEIIRLIAHEVAESKAKATAVALACCCRIFEDPVLDVLWETQENLLPLLRTLPGGVWKESVCTVSEPETHISSSLKCLIPKSFKRRPTTLERARFRNYARRMRKIREHGRLRVLSLEVFSVLQRWASDEPLFPNLGTLVLWFVSRKFVPFIPLFLSPRTTVIGITFDESDPPKAMGTSVVTSFPTMCPNLRRISLRRLPRDPTVIAAVSGMILASNRNTLQYVDVDSPLTEEARATLYTHSDLRELSVVVEKDLPPVVLPNLTKLTIGCNHDSDWLGIFREATFGKLEVVTFNSESKPASDFLETFERAALAASLQNALSGFYLYTPHPWNPSYPSLLSFTRLTSVVIYFSCVGGCSSSVEDGIITDLAQAMPKLENLQLGGPPCREIRAGVTAKGLALLAHHCQDLAVLRVHFRVASLYTPPTIAGMTSNVDFTTMRRNNSLKNLMVGAMPMPEALVPMVALTLAQIFPRIEYVGYIDRNWEKVVDAIRLSRQNLPR